MLKDKLNLREATEALEEQNDIEIQKQNDTEIEKQNDIEEDEIIMAPVKKKRTRKNRDKN
jgi:hypothetical protein